MKFSELNLAPEILAGLDEMGYEVLAPVQEQRFLKDKTHLSGGIKFFLIHDDIPAVLWNKTGEDFQEGGFPATRWTNNADKLSRINIEGYVAQGLDLFTADSRKDFLQCLD